MSLGSTQHTCPVVQHDNIAARRTVAGPAAFANARRQCARLGFACLIFGAASGTAAAATNGFFVQGNALISIGSSSVSVARRMYGGGDGNTVYGLANDGRFGYGLGAGYVRNQFGVRLRYLALGTQPTLSVNGDTEVSRRGVSSRYLGLEGLYFVPVTRRADLVLIGGAGLLRTTAPTPGSFHGPVVGTVTQNEPVITFGAGLQFAVTKHLSAHIDVTRLTPFQSGLRARGIYNNGQTVVAGGLAYTF